MAAVAAVGLAAGVAQTLFSALQTKQVREMCSMFGCESQLKKLEDTVSTIKALLLDVESKRQGLSHEGHLWVEKLKDAVYDVDDLLDEFTTIAHQRKQLQGAKFPQKVLQFFSRNNRFFVAFNVSREINLLRENLDAIAKNHAQFGFTDLNEPVKRREETCSYVFEEDVIGREDEKEDVVGMLLLSDSYHSYQNLSFVTIVGIGGLGKTALAQLVYNDERVKRVFSMRIWVCVTEDFGIREILSKIIGKEELTLEEMQRKVRNLLERERYLLVLDDVWNEDPEKWVKLRSFLVSDLSGSKIIVTSRSKRVARAIGEDSIIYELKGLLEENSWRLFKRVGFTQREDEANLVEIGKDIVKKCANVPLSIRVIGSLLYDQDESKWLWFRSMDLADISDGEDYIMSTLMFSYYQLATKLKSCFSFCSLFPKDHVIQKKLLISLWLAQGFLVTTHQHQSVEDVGEHYFTILLNRCFFQDVKLDEHGDVYSCKMHDLMHDLARQVAGKESLIMTGDLAREAPNHFRIRRKIRHLSLVTGTADAGFNNWFKLSDCPSDTLRTFLQLKYYKFSILSKDVAAILSHGRHLRVLDLNNFGVRTLPNKLGKLLHLRYLDLSVNLNLEILPNTIAKLHNLQILKLYGCMNLKELPDDTSKLVNLRTLDINRCNKLTHMPRGMYNLKNLNMLPLFVVGGVDMKQIRGSKLVDLKALTSLKGDLCIRVQEFSLHNIPRAPKSAFILKDAGIKNLEIRCDGQYYGQLRTSLRHYRERDHRSEQSQVHEVLLEELCPNHDVSKIMMVGYEGTKLPSWASMMVSMQLSNINGLQNLTSLSRLCHLKILKLQDLQNVEYIETDALSVLVSRARESSTFFPVLKELVVEEMPKLKGWWRDLNWMEREGLGGFLVDANGEQASTLPFFPSLNDLVIKDCWCMTYFPPCPHVKNLDVKGVNEALTFCMKEGIISNAVMCGTSALSAPLSSTSSVPVLSLQKLKIKNASVLNSLFREFVGGAVDIEISSDYGMESMGVVREGFQRCASSFQHLSINCCDVKSLRGGGIENLTNLQSLKIDNCFELDVEDEEEEGMPWKYLHCLSSLTLINLRKMVNLPKGFQYLTSLQSLQIESCSNLEELGTCLEFLTSLQKLQIICCIQVKSLPASICHLTSLTTLYICEPCNELKERCQEPCGPDWLNICNIPNVHIW